MSLQVLNAHTGARYSPGPESLTSLNTLRTWIAKASTVAAQNQILLTAQGRQAKLQTLRLEVRLNPTFKLRGFNHFLRVRSSCMTGSCYYYLLPALRSPASTQYLLLLCILSIPIRI